MIIIIFSYFFLLVIAIVLVLVTRSQKKQPIQNALPVSFIIPFRNEAQRLRPLINSINNATWSANFEFIFVNDHSTDHSQELLMNELDVPFRILNLRKTFGKKNALIYGIQNATHAHIHSLDADIFFDKDFLMHINRLPAVDMIILPVSLSGKSFFQQLNKIEFQWLQTFTFALAAVNRPFLCNGANLSFSKHSFLNTLPDRKDLDKASGDDIYLLGAIKKKGGVITASAAQELSISTPAPTTLRSLINQRIRWIKKLVNGPTIAAILIYAIYHIVPFYCLFYFDDNLYRILPFVLKIFAEWILSQQYNIRQLLLVLAHQLYYPIYGLILLSMLPFKNRWK